MKKRIFFCLLLLTGPLLLLTGALVKKKPLPPDHPKIWKKTDLWEAVKLHSKEKDEELTAFLQEHRDIIDEQEPYYGQTLLLWGARKGYYDFCELLLDNGANPDVQANDGTTALIQAANLAHAALIRLLLRKQADPNIVAEMKPIDSYQPMRTALIVAAGNSLEHTQLLVEAGADINYTCDKFRMQNAVVSAMRARKIEVARYLIIEQKINLDNIIHLNHKKDTVDIRTYLRDLAFELESEEYKIKMEIVDHLQRNKIDYWAAPVPRNMYHNFSTDYLKRY